MTKAMRCLTVAVAGWVLILTETPGWALLKLPQVENKNMPQQGFNKVRKLFFKRAVGNEVMNKEKIKANGLDGVVAQEIYDEHGNKIRIYVEDSGRKFKIQFDREWGTIPVKVMRQTNYGSGSYHDDYYATLFEIDLIHVRNKGERTLPYIPYEFLRLIDPAKFR